jgi:23S rRNA G2445 N2-methylase RlmL
MDRYIAQTSRGLADVLEKEVKALGLEVVAKSSIGIEFLADVEGCYRANLHLRTATRVLKPILEFKANSNDNLYNGIRKHDFTQYIGPKETLAIDSTVRDSFFTDQRFVTLKSKDAIVDQFREKFDERPDIDADDPDLQIMVRIVEDNVSVAIDTSGIPLTRRGYRKEQGEAPLREHLAAGLLYLAGWNEDIPLYDPMCGSGTILIEAALIARNIAPGSFKNKFAFQRLKNFEPEVWEKVLSDAMEAETEQPLLIFGTDRDSKVLRMAEANARRAGVDDTMKFERAYVDAIVPPPELEGKKGILIVNPPYGERLGVDEQLKDVYRDFAFGLKQNFKGWTMWMISGNDELTAALKLKSSRKIQVFNGNLDCRFLEYKIN